MWVVNSFIIASVLLGMILLCVALVAKFKQTQAFFVTKRKRVLKICICLVVCLGTVVCNIILLPYIWPFNRKVSISRAIILDVHDVGLAPFVCAGEWYGVYGEVGLSVDSCTLHPSRIDRWIEIDLQSYSYIVSYGQSIEDISYNIWDEIGGTYGKCIKKGYITFSNQFDPEKIFIYEIERIAIDNAYY